MGAHVIRVSLQTICFTFRRKLISAPLPSFLINLLTTNLYLIHPEPHTVDTALYSWDSNAVTLGTVGHANAAADKGGTLNHSPCGSPHLSAPLHHIHNSALPHSDRPAIFGDMRRRKNFPNPQEEVQLLFPSRCGNSKAPHVSAYRAIMWQGESPPGQRSFLVLRPPVR